MKQVEDEKIINNKIWVVTAKPWKECPFKMALVVLTSEGQTGAIVEFKKFYGNKEIEIEEAYEAPFVKGLVEEPVTA